MQPFEALSPDHLSFAPEALSASSPQLRHLKGRFEDLLSW